MNVEQLFSLEGKTVLVTGGARGIGRSYCEIFAAAKANVIIVSISESENKIAALELAEKYGVNTLGIKADVTKPSEIKTMIEKSEATFGQIDVAVHNAGIVNVFPAIDISYEEYRKVLDVNLDGVFLCSQAVAKSMVKNKVKGSIINIGSMSAHIINLPQTIACYEASKAGVVHLTKALAVEWATYGIRVNSISPGYVMTELVAEMSDMHPIWKEKIPMNRLASPNEIAPLALYLATDASSYVTGSDMIIDGGYTCI